MDLHSTDPVDVVFAMTGDVRHNSRALRQLRALSEFGLTVHVIAFGRGGVPLLDIPGTRLELVEPPASSGPTYFWEVHQAARRSAARISASLFHASDLYVLGAMAGTAGDRHARLVYDARELYPYVAASIGRPWVRIFWRLAERRFIRQADLVITVSDGIADKLVDLYGIARPIVLHNVPDRVRPSTRKSFRVATDLSTGEALILHQGQLREHRGCELLVDAMRDVEGAILIFLGDGPLRIPLEEQASKAKISSRVRFVDPVPPNELLAYTASADIGVSLLEDTCLNHRFALPNKLFEYLAANVPVVASDLPEIRKIIGEYDVGLLVEPGNRADLVAALNQAVLDKSLRERWRRNIPRALETFNWAKASEYFLLAYQNLLARAR